MDYNKAAMYGIAGAGLGNGIFNLFGGYKNPADEAAGSIDQIPNKMSPYYQPFIDVGLGAIPGLEQQYNQLINNPGNFINGIGQSYHQSPGFDFAKNQALQAVGNAAAAGGMAGSPQHQQQVAAMVTGLADQDFNNWFSKALGAYGMGLNGQQNLFQTGYNASDSLAQSIANSMLSKAKLQYEGANARNQAEGGGLGSLLGSAGTIASIAGLF